MVGMGLIAGLWGAAMMKPDSLDAGERFALMAYGFLAVGFYGLLAGVVLAAMIWLGLVAIGRQQ